MSESRPLPPQPNRPPGLRPPSAPVTPNQPPKIAGLPTQPSKAADADLEPISLVDEPAESKMITSKIRSMGAPDRSAAFKRQPHATGQGAIRVRSFHGRLSDEGMAFLDDKINEWLDQHPEIEVKFATTTIGQYEGKIRELALIVNVWY